MVPSSMPRTLELIAAWLDDHDSQTWQKINNVSVREELRSTATALRNAGVHEKGSDG